VWSCHDDIGTTSDGGRAGRQSVAAAIRATVRLIATPGAEPSRISTTTKVMTNTNRTIWCEKRQHGSPDRRAGSHNDARDTVETPLRNGPSWALMGV
jgi:hypothetical protein